MKALTLTQPWATLVAIGAKRFETRSWSTAYRGPLAIHAAKGMPNDAIALLMEQPFRRCLEAAGIDRLALLPRGAVIATAYLARVMPTSALRGGFDAEQLDQELAFGDYSPGRFMWVLDGVQPLAAPIPAKGSLGLWDWVNTAFSPLPADLDGKE